MWNPLKTRKPEFRLDSKDEKRGRFRMVQGVKPTTAVTIVIAIVTLYLYVLPGLDLRGAEEGRYTPDFGELHEHNVEYYDLKDYSPHADGWNHNERVLFLVPLRMRRRTCRCSWRTSRTSRTHTP